MDKGAEEKSHLEISISGNLRVFLVTRTGDLQFITDRQ